MRDRLSNQMYDLLKRFSLWVQQGINIVHKYIGLELKNDETNENFVGLSTLLLLFSFKVSDSRK